jgi:hypothetical protein
VPHKDPDERRAANRIAQRRRRSAASNGGAGGRPAADRCRKTSAPGQLDPADVLMRLPDELDRLDQAEDLDPAVRARTIARVCAVALVAYKQVGPVEAGERDAQILRARLSELALLGRAAILTRQPPET